MTQPTQLRVIKGGEEKEHALTILTATLGDGTQVAGVDGPYPIKEDSLLTETQRITARLNGGGFFHTSNGVIFNTKYLAAIDIDIHPVQAGREAGQNE